MNSSSEKQIGVYCRWMRLNTTEGGMTAIVVAAGAEGVGICHSNCVLAREGKGKVRYSGQNEGLYVVEECKDRKVKKPKFIFGDKLKPSILTYCGGWRVSFKERGGGELDCEKYKCPLHRRNNGGEKCFTEKALGRGKK